MALRFEAWTLPWSTTFERVIADLPAVTGSRGMVRLSDYGEAAIILPEDYDRLADVISSTVGTLIRVFDGTTIVQEFLAERVEHSNRDAGTVTVSGPDLDDVFNRTVVYPFDYPLNPSAFPDFVWGGANVLSNPGFEDGLGTNDVYEVWTDHTGGTFTLSAGVGNTVAFDHNEDTNTLELRIQDLSNINDVTVTGGGVEADPWAITFFSPTSVTLTGNGTNLTGGTTLSVVEVQSAESEAGAWTVSQGADQSIDPRVHGAATISVVTTPVDTGTYSLRIVATELFGGAQQVVRVEPGGTYQASIRIRSTGTGPFRFVIRDLYENLIARYDFSVTANTWTTATIADVVIPAGVEAVIFRIAYTGTATQTFYIDNAEFNEGMAATNAGAILGMLMADAAVDHAADARGAVLDWIDYTTFSTTVDSSSVSWVDDLSITAYAGMTYGQFFDALVQLGYEWRLTPKAVPGATTHDLELYMTGNLGTDYSASATPAINFGQGTIGGPVVQRIPAYTRVLTIGADNAFIEDTDATALTNFGPFETSRQDTAWNNTATLSAAANELLDSESRNRIAVQVSVIATRDHPRPLVNYTVGDTLYFQIPPALPKTARRVRSIAWSHGEPATYQVTGSRIFDAESGAWEAVRRLLREFKKPAVKASGGITLGGGKIPWLVAASDSPDTYKNVAGYICSGSNDHETVQAAHDAVVAAGATSGGEVWLAPGFYLFGWPGGGAPCVDAVNSGVRLVGVGEMFSTLIQVGGTTNTNDVVFDRWNGGAENIQLIDVSGGSGATIGFAPTSPYSRFQSCWIEMLGYAINTESAGLHAEHCRLESYGQDATSAAVRVQAGGAGSWTVHIRDCDIVGPEIGVDIYNGLTGTTATESQIHVTNNRISAGIGVQVISTTRRLFGAVVSGNAFADAAVSTTSRGMIHLDTVDNSVVANNTIDLPWRHGIELVDCVGVAVTGNVIVGASALTTNTYDGIILSGDSNDNSVQSNRVVPSAVTETTRYGLNVSAATCDNNVAADNFLGDVSVYGTGGYNNAGTGTITARDGNGQFSY